MQILVQGESFNRGRENQGREKGWIGEINSQMLRISTRTELETLRENFGFQTVLTGGP